MNAGISVALGNLGVPRSFALPPCRSAQRQLADEVSVAMAENFRLARAKFVPDPIDVGMHAWFVRPIPKPNGTRLRIFGNEDCVAMGALVLMGLDPRAAVALVDLDFVIAVGEAGRDVSGEVKSRGLVWVANVALADGDIFAILATKDLSTLKPEHIQAREGYFAVASASSSSDIDDIRASVGSNIQLLTTQSRHSGHREH